MRVWSIAVLLSLVAEAGTPAQATAISFTLDSQGGIFVSAVFNDAGPYRVLLDTGASHSSISEDVARAIGAPPIARSVVSSPAGQREYIIVRVDRVAIGPIGIAATATVLPVTELLVAGAIDGVLGQDVLAGLRYTIDYRQRLIVWEDSSSMPEVLRRGGKLPLTYRDGLPIVEIQHGDSTLRLVADSGAGGLVLFESAGRELPAMRADGGLVRLDSFQGSRTARSVVIDELRIGHSTFRDVPAVLVKASKSAAHRSDGLLPLHFFRRVTFDGPGRRLILG
jgi:predicted aspartyl protease